MFLNMKKTLCFFGYLPHAYVIEQGPFRQYNLQLFPLCFPAGVLIAYSDGFPELLTHKVWRFKIHYLPNRT